MFWLRIIVTISNSIRIRFDDGGQRRAWQRVVLLAIFKYWRVMVGKIQIIAGVGNYVSSQKLAILIFE